MEKERAEQGHKQKGKMYKRLSTGGGNHILQGEGKLGDPLQKPESKKKDAPSRAIQNWETQKKGKASHPKTCAGGWGA